jgi:uncharacterized protein YecE (DUF72 family)
MEVLIGTSGWTFKDWIGAFYPADAQSHALLGLYSRHFRTVEVDSTFYGTPRASAVEAWRKKTPEEFVFSLKVPREITHDALLKDRGPQMEEFVDRVRPLGPKLGCILIQLPPYFTGRHFDHLAGFVGALPGDLDFAVEFRHRDLFRDETYDLLRSRRVAMVHTHRAKRTLLTADFHYVRWLGNRAEPMPDFSREHRSREEDHARWVALFRDLPPDLRRVYGYFNNHYTGHSPAAAKTFSKLLAQSASPPLTS